MIIPLKCPETVSLVGKRRRGEFRPHVRFSTISMYLSFAAS